MLDTFGIISAGKRRHWTGASPFLPEFSFHECHESRLISAPAVDIIAAVASLDIRDDRVVGTLMSLREFPARVVHQLRKTASRPAPAPLNFSTFTLLERTATELSLGLAGRFWRPDVVIRHIPTATQFDALNDARAAKLVLRFQVIEQGNNTRTLRTETFIHCANTRTKMLFTPYWLLIRLASGWIRRRMLRTIEQAVARHAGPPPAPEH